MTEKIQFPRAGKYGQIRRPDYRAIAQVCAPIDLLVMALNALERAAKPLEILQERQDPANMAESQALRVCIENHVETWDLVLEAIRKQEMAVELAQVGLRTARQQKLDS